MATIQRTFKDPALQNPLKYLGYDSIPVEIEHGGASENYFNVQGIGPELVGARLQPLRNTDTFNIRWAKRVYINRDGLNTSEITYIRPPQIEVSELKLPYYISHFNTELTSSLSNAITSANPVVQNEITCSIYQLSSSHNTEAKISYIKQREQIYLELTSSDFGGFVQDMENGTVFFEYWFQVLTQLFKVQDRAFMK